MPDALVGAHGAAQFGCAGAVVSGLRNEAFPGYGAAGDGEDDEAAVAEALARVAVGGVAVASEEVGARGAGRQGVVGEVEILGGNEVEGHPQEAAEGKVGEGLLVDEAGDNAVGKVGIGASCRDDEANGAGDALGERQKKGDGRGGGSRGEEATKGVRGHGGVARDVVSKGLADQEELEVADDAEARDLDGAVRGDVVADAR